MDGMSPTIFEMAERAPRKPHARPASKKGPKRRVARSRPARAAKGSRKAKRQGHGRARSR